MYKRITNPSILIALIAVFTVGVFFLIGCGDDDADITHADDDHVEGDEHDDEHAEAEHVEGDEHAASENAKALIRVEIADQQKLDSQRLNVVTKVNTTPLTQK